MKFTMLFSCGKDSALALHRLIQQGHEPLSLIITYNEDADRSWFHGVTSSMIDEVESSLDIPIIRCKTSGDDYHLKVEEAINEAREKGAEAAAFGDIDIQQHLEWNRERCRNAKVDCLMPLWNESRKDLVNETIDSGFKAIIKTVTLDMMGEEFLGATLTHSTVKKIDKTGADICGENGEYHTFVYDGPIYKNPIPIHLGDIINLNTHSVIDINLK